MEYINDFIAVELAQCEPVSESNCLVQDLGNAYHFIYILSEKDCFFDFPNSYNRIIIRISKTYFEKYQEHFEIIVEKQNLCCNTQAKLYDIITCTLTGFSRKIFIESVVLYLIFQVQKNNLLFQINCSSCSFVNIALDPEKIQTAKDYILTNLEENLTIPIISKFIKTNQCYLKKAFKEVVGMTIFDFIQENRMIKAQYLLNHTSKSIAEVASKVGYASASSLSQSYKNYFGITPNQRPNISNN
ncbi:MAG: AraC family transcriptional regulator [Alphaproteobacteria bacterium]|nr:AraC family transcriptional regulator [Alphaproteobacteria bacterium]